MEAKIRMHMGEIYLDFFYVVLNLLNGVMVVIFAQCTQHQLIQEKKKFRIA